MNGPRKANVFEVLNFIHGRCMTNFFEIKSKKKEPISMPSPFPKKKANFKIMPSGSLLPFFFYTREEPTMIFD